jgi:NAD+ synthase (glutamine-hydrolysing)
MAPLRVVGAQLDTVVGDLDGNVARISAALEQADELGADLCVFPELTITGYPPEDLLLKPGFVRDNVRALERAAAATHGCAAVIGFVEPLEQNHRLANAAAVCAAGEVVGVYRKRRLPNYGVFDEQRWFDPGFGDAAVFDVAGTVVGVSICEDVWDPDGPVVELAGSGARVIVNLNSSPYSRNRRTERLAMLRARVSRIGCPIVYVNQIGGQDELVFDGASLVVAGDGSLLASGPQFDECLVVADVEPGPATAPSAPVIAVPAARGAARARGARRPYPVSSAPVPPLEPDAEVYGALVLGTRDYLAKSGFADALVNVSGGIDSALVAAIAVDALGPAHVHATSMPSRYSSAGSRTDAAELMENLGVELWTVPIESLHADASALLAEALGTEPVGLTDENLQSRLRGLLLMAISNEKGWIVLTTGNKSEMATGYSTLYGDSAGGFAVIKDVPKLLVYDLCRFVNRRAESEGRIPPIPEAILRKPPSAELRPDQRDEESLPPYEILDPVLEAYVEQDRTAAELVELGFAPEVVDRVVRLVDGAEYKRRQMAPGVRITAKAFGKDRRMPITNHYRGSARAELAEAEGV